MHSGVLIFWAVFWCLVQGVKIDLKSCAFSVERDKILRGLQTTYSESTFSSERLFLLSKLTQWIAQCTGNVKHLRRTSRPSKLAIQAGPGNLKGMSLEWHLQCVTRLIQLLIWETEASPRQVSSSKSSCHYLSLTNWRGGRMVWVASSLLPKIRHEDSSSQSRSLFSWAVKSKVHWSSSSTSTWQWAIGKIRSMRSRK